MKTIALMLVKNDAWILPTSLAALSQICDVIIVADQMSDDGSREIYRNFSKVVTFDNRPTTHFYEAARKDLLVAARAYDGNNLLLCVDADEIFPPFLFNSFINETEIAVGTSLSFQWIQLWKSIHFYNDSDVWANSWKPIAWVDDRTVQYPKDHGVKIHMGRIPPDLVNRKVNNVPLLHFQWTMWDKVQMKQAWYRCMELIKDPKRPAAINSTYSITLEGSNTKLTSVPKEWLEGLHIPETIEKSSDSWRFKEMINLFDQYGINFFEPLQIWHIPQLREEFIKRLGREPKPTLKDPFFAKVQSRLQREWQKMKGLKER